MDVDSARKYVGRDELAHQIARKDTRFCSLGLLTGCIRGWHTCRLDPAMSWFKYGSSSNCPQIFVWRAMEAPRDHSDTAARGLIGLCLTGLDGLHIAGRQDRKYVGRDEDIGPLPRVVVDDHSNRLDTAARDLIGLCLTSLDRLQATLYYSDV
jgi:hypothetical protein